MSPKSQLKSLKARFKRILSDREVTTKVQKFNDSSSSSSSSDKKKMSSPSRFEQKKSSSSGSSVDSRKEHTLSRFKKKSYRSSSSTDGKKGSPSKKKKKKKFSSTSGSSSDNKRRIPAKSTKKVQLLGLQSKLKSHRDETSRLSPSSKVPNDSKLLSEKDSEQRGSRKGLWGLTLSPTTSNETSSTARPRYSVSLNDSSAPSSPRRFGKGPEDQPALQSIHKQGHSLLGENEGNSSERSKKSSSKLKRIQSAHLDEERGVWRCRNCDWIYPNPNPSARHRRDHKKHCGEMLNVQQWLKLSQSGDQDFQDTIEEEEPCRLESDLGVGSSQTVSGRKQEETLSTACFDSRGDTSMGDIDCQGATDLNVVESPPVKAKSATAAEDDDINGLSDSLDVAVASDTNGHAQSTGDRGVVYEQEVEPEMGILEVNCPSSPDAVGDSKVEQIVDDDAEQQETQDDGGNFGNEEAAGRNGQAHSTGAKGVVYKQEVEPEMEILEVNCRTLINPSSPDAVGDSKVEQIVDNDAEQQETQVDDDGRNLGSEEAAEEVEEQNDVVETDAPVKEQYLEEDTQASTFDSPEDRAAGPSDEVPHANGVDAVHLESNGLAQEIHAGDTDGEENKEVLDQIITDSPEMVVGLDVNTEVDNLGIPYKPVAARKRLLGDKKKTISRSPSSSSTSSSSTVEQSDNDRSLEIVEKDSPRNTEVSGLNPNLEKENSETLMTQTDVPRSQRSAGEVEIAAAGTHSVVEYELERVIHDQKTHDIMCPVCGSCITKRVILRKRKRTVVLEDNPDFDLPDPPSPQPEVRHESWGCLACFSFFFRKDSDPITERDVDLLGDREGTPCLQIFFPTFPWASSNYDGVDSGLTELLVPERPTESLLPQPAENPPVDVGPIVEEFKPEDERVNCFTYLRRYRTAPHKDGTLPALASSIPTEADQPSAEVQHTRDLRLPVSSNRGKERQRLTVYQMSLGLLSPKFQQQEILNTYEVGPYSPSSKKPDKLEEPHTPPKSESPVKVGESSKPVSTKQDSVQGSEILPSRQDILPQEDIGEETIPARAEGSTPPLKIAVPEADSKQDGRCLPITISFPKFTRRSPEGHLEPQTTPKGEVPRILDGATLKATDQVSSHPKEDDTRCLPLPLTSLYRRPKLDIPAIEKRPLGVIQPQHRTVHQVSLMLNSPTLKLRPLSDIAPISRPNPPPVHQTTLPSPTTQPSVSPPDVIPPAESKIEDPPPTTVPSPSQTLIHYVPSDADALPTDPAPKKGTTDCLPLLFSTFLPWGSPVQTTEGPEGTKGLREPLIQDEASSSKASGTTCSTIVEIFLPTFQWGAYRAEKSLSADNSIEGTPNRDEGQKIIPEPTPAQPVAKAPLEDHFKGKPDSELKGAAKADVASALLQATRVNDSLSLVPSTSSGEGSSEVNRFKSKDVDDEYEVVQEESRVVGHVVKVRRTLIMSNNEISSIQVDKDVTHFQALYDENNQCIQSEEVRTAAMKQPDKTEAKRTSDRTTPRSFPEGEIVEEPIEEPGTRPTRPEEAVTTRVGKHDKHSCSCLPFGLPNLTWSWESNDLHQDGPVVTESAEGLPVSNVPGGHGGADPFPKSLPQRDRTGCIPRMPSLRWQQPSPGVDVLREPLLQQHYHTQQTTTTTTTTQSTVVTDSIVDIPQGQRVAGLDYISATNSVSTSSGEGMEVLRSMVYGGLDSTFISLGLVASATGGDAKTITVAAIGLSNVVFGLVTLLHTITSLYTRNKEEFKQTVGPSYRLNGFIAAFSYVFFGVLAPLTYALSFRHATNRDYKMGATCLVALLCIILLGAAKARVTSRNAVRLVSSLISTGFVAAISCYCVGDYVAWFLEQIGFDSV